MPGNYEASNNFFDRNHPRDLIRSALFIGLLVAANYIADGIDDSDPQTYPIAVVRDIDCAAPDPRQPLDWIPAPARDQLTRSAIERGMRHLQNMTSDKDVGTRLISDNGCTLAVARGDYSDGSRLDVTVAVKKSDGLPPPANYSMEIDQVKVRHPVTHARSVAFPASVVLVDNVLS
jgi:hypothetical protein